MADSKITGLGELSAAPASGDLFVIVDVSDTSMAASGTNKKLTWANAVLALTNGTTTMASAQTQVFTNGITISSGAQIKTGSSSDLVLFPASGVVRFTNSSGVERGRYAAGNNTWDIDPLPDATAASAFRFFRSTNTSGTKGIDIYKGDNTATLIHRIGINQATTFNANSEDLDFNVRGDTDAGLFFVDASADFVGIGTTTPSTKMHVLTSNAATNAVFNMVTLSGRSSGTAAASFGVGVAVQLESSTTNDQDAGRLTWAWATATHASRAAVGKLTAYYTSTEREALTWTATSTGVTVAAGGNFSVPSGSSFYAGGPTDTGTDGWRLVTTGGSAYMDHKGAGRLYLRSDNTDGSTEVASFASTGAIINTSLGIGVVNTQGLLHGHDGSGGFLFVNRTGVSSTLVTVIPDAAGDVTERLHMFGWVSNSAGGFVSQVNEVYLDVSSSTTKTDGSNTLTIAVTAGGAFTLQTTAGAATWKVLLWVFWR